MHTRRVLKLATLGMLLYATFSIGWAANDLFRGAQLETWAEIGLIGFGALLALAAVLLRSRVPGALAFAAAALLGLQALDVHNSVHLETGLPLQLMRAVFGLLVIGLAFVGGLPRRAPNTGAAKLPGTGGHRPPAGR